MMEFDVTVGDSKNVVDIDVRDGSGVVRANVYAEIYDGKVMLVVTPAIEERGSDEAKYVVDLLTGALSKEDCNERV